MSATATIAAMPQRAQSKPLRECQTLQEAFGTEEFMQRIRQGVPRHVSPDRMLRTFIQAVSKTPDLLKCSMRSVIGAMLTCSQVGFEPNTPLGHAYLIPFRTKRWNPETRQREETYEVQLIFGYPGLLDLSYRSGQLVSMHADVVWPKDTWSFEYGTDAHLRHMPRGRGDAVQPDWAYMHAKLKEGQAFEVMPYSDVLAIRNRSSGYQFALAMKEDAEKKGKNPPRAWTDAPWVRDEIAMGRKTVFRAGSKWLPRSIEMASILALDEASERGGVDFGAALEAPTIDGKVDSLGAALDTVETGEDPGATHGVRSQPAETATAQQQSAGTATTATGSTQQQDQGAPAFEAYLVNEYGEPTTDQPFTDPSLYASALVSLWMSSDNREAIVEGNVDGIADAEAASSEAAEIVAELQGSTPAAQPIRIELTQARGRDDWTGYVKAVKAHAPELTATTLPPFLALNAETFARAPQAQKLLLVKALTERANVLRLNVPQELVDLARPPPRAETEQATQAQESEDEDIRRGRLFLFDAVHATADGLRALQNNPAYQRVMQALDAKDAALKARIVEAIASHGRPRKLQDGPRGDEPPPNDGAGA